MTDFSDRMSQPERAAQSAVGTEWVSEGRPQPSAGARFMPEQQLREERVVIAPFKSDPQHAETEDRHLPTPIGQPTKHSNTYEVEQEMKT